MRRALVATTAVAGLLALATTAQAQDGRRVNLSAQVHVLHDTNFARSDDTLAAVRGVDPSETITTPTLTANINLPISRQNFFLKGSIGRDYHANNKALDAAHYDIVAGLGLQVALCQGTISGSYQEAQSDLQDLTLLTTKNVAKYTTGSFNMMCGRSTGFAPSVRASTTTTRNSARSLHLSDSDDTSAEVGLAYRRPSLGTITLFGSYSEIDYRDDALPVGGLDFIKNGFTTKGFGVRYDRNLGARIGGSLEVSYVHTQPELAIIQDFEGWTYLGRINFRVNSRFNTSLDLSRQTEPTIRQGSVYAISMVTRLAGTYSVGPRINLAGGIELVDNDFKGGAAALPINVLTEENIDAIFGSATYDIGRRFSVSLDLRYEERDANAPGFDYSSTQVGLTAIGKF